MDGAQGSFYLNSTNQNAGTLPVERLSGTYNISIANTSGNTLRLQTSVNSPTGNPTPDEFSAGIIADTKNNTADGLGDGGTRHMVLTLRNGGSDFDATFGGVRQLAFTDGASDVGAGMWIRGSYNSPGNPFGDWYEVWHSGNDGVDSGLDADRMDGRAGAFYQDAKNLNEGVISTQRLPQLSDESDVITKLRVVDWTGLRRVTLLVRDELLSTSPFTSGTNVNLYDAGGAAAGSIQLTKVQPIQDVNDAGNNYTLLTGSLSAGGTVAFESARFVGTGGVGNAYEFQDWTYSQINDNPSVDDLVDGTYSIFTAESSGGDARVRLGRVDGFASDPSIYFNSSALTATNYNVALIATGGNATDGSGSLEIKVANNNALTVNGNNIWNSGTVEFYSSNTLPTTDANNNITNRSAVMRDVDGNFAANEITATLIGSASDNVLKAGDTMSGALTIGGVAVGDQALSVSGRADFLSNITVEGTNNLAITSQGEIRIEKDGLCLSLQPDNSGSYSLIDFKSRANSGSDKAFILVQDETSFSAGTSTEDLRMTIGVYNDFRQSASHSDEFWLQGGGRQVFNVGSWDSELNTIIGTPGSGTASGGPQYEWRINNDVQMWMLSNGNLGVGATPGDYKLRVEGDTYIDTSLTISDAADNNGAVIYFLGSTGAVDGGTGDTLSTWRVGNSLVGDDIFEITPNDGSQGSTTWKATPALAIQGTNNRVAINTTVFSGQDQTDPQNIIDRDYSLNVEGDLNINNGNLFVDNAPFVTSRWTESSDANGANIYRLSRVGINKEDPTYTLHIGTDEVTDASVNIAGSTFTNGVNTSVLHANDDPQYLDSYGVFKANRNTVGENVTVPANTNAMSAGPIEIGNNVIITVASGGTWTIV